MPIRNEAITVVYTAWDTLANAPKTGDAANHSLSVAKDGVAASATNSPVELSSGEYSLDLTAGEMDANFVKVFGSSSTEGVSIMPLALPTERGLLDVPVSTRSSHGPGDIRTELATELGRIDVAISTRSDHDETDVRTELAPELAMLDAAVSSRSTLAAEDVWTYVTRTLTGMSIDPADIQAGLDAQGYTSARALLLDFLDAAISTRALDADLTDFRLRLEEGLGSAFATGEHSLVEIMAAIASLGGGGGGAGAVWDALSVNHLVPGSFGAIVADMYGKISSGAYIVETPIGQTGHFTIFRGYDYTSSLGTALAWSSEEWVDLTGYEWVGLVKTSRNEKEDIVKEGVMTQVGSGLQTAVVEMTEEDIEELKPGVHLLVLKAIKDGEAYPMLTILGKVRDLGKEGGGG